MTTQRKSRDAAYWLAACRNNGQRFPGGDVYFVQHETGGFIKIGVSVHVAARLASLNAQSHDPRYRLLATIPRGGTFYEHIFHDEFAHLREHSEWFRPERDLLDFITHVQESTDG